LNTKTKAFTAAFLTLVVLAGPGAVRANAQENTDALTAEMERHEAGRTTASAPQAALQAYDTQEDATHRFKATINTLTVENKASGESVSLPMTVKGMAMAYGRLYIAQGRKGLIAFDLSSLKAHRAGKKLLATERMLNLDAHGLAIDSERQIAFISRSQAVPGKSTATSGVSVWHFPDPRKQELPVFPMVPIAFQPAPYATGLAYDSKASRLYVAARQLGIGSFDVKQKGESITLEARGVAQPVGQLRTADPSTIWTGVGLSTDHKALILTGRSYGTAAERLNFDPIQALSLEQYEKRLAQTQEQSFAEAARALDSPSERAYIAWLKFGQGFFSMHPDSDFVDVLYKARAMEMLEKGELTKPEYDRLMSRVAVTETAGRIVGATSFVVVTSILPALGSIRAAGGIGAATTAFRAALANPRALIPALVRFVPTQLKNFKNNPRFWEITMDFTWSTVLTYALDVYLERPKDLLIRDMVLMSFYSAILSVVGLSPNVTRMQRAKVFAGAAFQSTHITMNIEGRDSEEYLRTQAYSLCYAVVPLLPWSSLTRYEVFEKILNWISTSTGSKHDKIMAPALAAWFKNHPKWAAGILFATNQGYATVAYVKSDEFYRSTIWPDAKAREGFRASLDKVTEPYRALLDRPATAQ
jgi:hypothetical protein